MSNSIKSTMDEFEGYKAAYELAKEELRKLDLQRQCELAGATFIEHEGKALLKLFSDIYEVVLPDCDVKCITDKHASIQLKILALHYLAQSTGTPLTGKLIDFRELPSGIAYHVSFDSRVKKPLLKAFSNAERLLIAAKHLEAEEIDYGDAGLRIWALPKVPIIIAYWAADEEMPASISILFDSSISGYLTTEDVAVLGEHLAEKLISASGQGL